jgi:hypothetical protein
MAAGSAYFGGMDEKARQKLALFRIAVLGPLVGARLEHGELVELCREAATRTWELPSGAVIDVSARTIEDWFYAYQRDGFAGLHPKCVFHAISITDSAASRSGIPREADHPFHGMPIGHSTHADHPEGVSDSG